MKRITLLLCFALLSIIIIIAACRKENSSRSNNTFDAKAAKEWYYATFKKSAEWKNSLTKGNQLPDWKHGIVNKIGDFEIVEFPLIKKNKIVGIVSAGGTENERKRIAENTLERMIFVKTNSGKIFVRELQYIPNTDYLSKSGYDISRNSLGSIDSKFSGVLSVRSWGNKELVRNKLVDGKVKARSHPQSAQQVAKGSRIQCDGVLVTEYQSDCDIRTTIQGDDVMITITCSEWYPTGSEWCISDEDVDPNGSCGDPTGLNCFCELVGGCEEEGGGGQEENCQAVYDQLYGQAVNDIETTTTTNETPTTRTRTYKWTIYSQNQGLWKFSSHETGIHVKENNDWKWQSFTHDNITRSGLLVGGSVTCTLANANPYVGVYWASMTINYNIEASVVCKGSPLSESHDYTSTLVRNVAD